MAEQQQLDFNNLHKFFADQDRDTTMQVSVWGGNASLAVFQGPGAPKLKIPLSNKILVATIPAFLKKLKGMTDPGSQIKAAFTRFLREEKKRETFATLVFGRDDKGQAYIGVAGQGLSKPAKFIIRPPLDIDLAQMSVQEQSALAIDGLIQVFTSYVPVASMLTSFKREFGGNRGGGGGYGGGGRSSGGGGSDSGGDRSQSSGGGNGEDPIF